VAGGGVFDASAGERAHHEMTHVSQLSFAPREAKVKSNSSFAMLMARSGYDASFRRSRLNAKSELVAHHGCVAKGSLVREPSKSVLKRVQFQSPVAEQEDHPGNN
jgi:hypothetical protein